MSVFGIDLIRVGVLITLFAGISLLILLERSKQRKKFLDELAATGRKKEWDSLWEDYKRITQISRDLGLRKKQFGHLPTNSSSEKEQQYAREHWELKNRIGKYASRYEALLSGIGSRLREWALVYLPQSCEDMDPGPFRSDPQ